MRIVSLSVALLLAGSIVQGEGRNLHQNDAALRHPAPGTAIIRFGQVDTGVYRGSKPENDADFRFLKSKHVRYILDARFLPFLAAPEARRARKYGMTFISSPMNGSPVAPSEQHVNRILLILRNKRYWPIYFHCDLGRDRTSLIAALYKMYFLHVSKQAAWEDMKYYGFKDSWTLRGLKEYFEKHSTPSPSLVAAARALNR
jgi:protein-tyrosine phosphatase